MNNNETTKLMFSYKIFDEIFDKRAREVSNISRENKSIHSVKAMLNKARKNVSNIGQHVFFINDDRTHRIKKEIHENQYIHIDPEFSLSQNLKNRMRQGQATPENIHAYLKNVSNNINSKPKMTEFKRILKDKIREQGININNS